MRKSRFSEEQIIAVLGAQERRETTAEAWRRYGISSPTFYKWKVKYGGMDVSDTRRPKLLETENGRLTATRVPERGDFRQPRPCAPRPRFLAIRLQPRASAHAFGRAHAHRSAAGGPARRRPTARRTRQPATDRPSGRRTLEMVEGAKGRRSRRPSPCHATPRTLLLRPSLKRSPPPTRTLGSATRKENAIRSVVTRWLPPTGLRRAARSSNINALFRFGFWWAVRGSNSRHSRCK